MFYTPLFHLSDMFHKSHKYLQFILHTLSAKQLTLINLNRRLIFSIHYFFTEGKKVKGWLGIEGVGGVGLDR